MSPMTTNQWRRIRRFWMRKECKGLLMWQLSSLTTGLNKWNITLKNQEQEKAKREHLFKDLESRCFQCGHTGHFKNECKTRFQVGRPQEAGRPKEKNLEPVKEETFERSAHNFTLKERVIPVTKWNWGQWCGRHGADATVISSDFASVAGIDTRCCQMACLHNAQNGADMTAFGGVTAMLLIGSDTTSWPVYIAH